MKFLQRAKDGGPESTVTGYWLIEIKWLFSIVLLKFGPGSRDAFHDHAFDAVSWLLRGQLDEQFLFNTAGQPEPTFECWYKPSWRPILTRRSYFHRVESTGTSWVLSFRGPWSKTWREYDPNTGLFTSLAHGRKDVTP